MVGMAGQAANGEIGLVIAGYEWLAAITLVAVAFFFLPRFLKSGIFTIPQFLEHRFDGIARTVMSVLMVIMLVSVNISLVTYLGAKFLDPYLSGIGTVDIGFLYPINSIVLLCWTVGILAAAYVAVGGLKACAWADLIQGAALILGGAVITVLAIQALGDPDPSRGMNQPEMVAQLVGVESSAGIGERLGQLREDRMHMILPWTSSVIPWTALIIGLWIPNFYYWGLNQYIMQRALGAKSLAEGQKGVVFAAGMKLIIPFVVCVPGIIAFVLYSDLMAEKADQTNNAPIMQRYEEVSANSESVLFAFNDDFVVRHEDRAEAILTHNLSIVGGDRDHFLSLGKSASNGIDPEDGKPWTAAEEFANANSAVLAEADAGTEVVGTLVGYDYDDAFPILVANLAGSGFKGFVIAAVMGAVVSSLASMLNAASTIFTMDIYKKFLAPEATQGQLVWVGRVCVGVAVILGCLIAPIFANPDLGGAFNAIQSLQTYLSPGILTIFLFGLFVPRAPRVCGVIGLILSPILAFAYAQIQATAGFEDASIGGLLFNNFLNRAALVVFSIAIILGIITAIRPLAEPIKLPEQSNMDLKSSPIAKVMGIAVCVLTVVLYIVFA